MIPDYLKFIRYQDKRLIPYLYLITFILLGLYWKNNDYTLAQVDAWSISVVLSLIFFLFTYELKNYWAYKCGIKNMDFSYFHGKVVSRYDIIISRPIVTNGICWIGFYCLAKMFLLFLLPFYALLCIALFSPLIIYLVFRLVRYSYVIQMSQAVAERVKYRNLHSYVCFNVIITFLMSVIIVAPLRSHDDFSLSEGFFSARLMVAMLILCTIVLAINLVFARPSRRYIFLGRLFLKEFDFTLSSTIPLSSLYEKTMLFKCLFLLIAESLWIIVISLILSLLDVGIYFEVYFLLCILPVVSYFYIHVYWRWHNDYMMSCDMFLRCDGIEKKNTLW